MATYDATTHPLAFAHMEGGVKTVYVVPDSNEFKGISSGDRIEFDDLGSVTVGMIRRYTALEELVEAEGFGNVVPECATAEEAISSIRSSSGWDGRAAQSRGVLALRVRSAKRKS
jgi:ASC-1-like (ASCH) protein